MKFVLWHLFLVVIEVIQGATAMAGELDANASSSSVNGASLGSALYAIRLNGKDMGDALILHGLDGSISVRGSDLYAWRLHQPDAPPITFIGESYYPLSAYPNIHLSVNEDQQLLVLEIPPKNFITSVFDQQSVNAKAVLPSSIGGFGNYDLFYNEARGSKALNGLFEAGIFTQQGIGTSTFLAQTGDLASHITRLETAWTHDFPDDMTTLTLGDAIGVSGLWGRPVRFGGFRYGTNYATQPGFITQPLPRLSGQVDLPSTTELYVNNVLRQQGTLPSGPFQINNLPVINGQGDVSLVVHDLLGREVVINQPYYASNKLLREGLVEKSAELGFIRNNFGGSSDGYGRFIATMQERKGISDGVTGEIRTELLHNQLTAGAGGSMSFPSLGVFSAGAAISHNATGNGGLVSIAFDRQVMRGISFGFHSQWTTHDFTQLGLQTGQLAPALVMSTGVGYNTSQNGSLGLSYVTQINRGTLNNEILTASYSKSIFRSSSLIFTALKTLSGEPSQAVFLALSVSLGGRSNVSVNSVAQANANQLTTQYQENLPAGSGYGYRILASEGEHSSRQEIQLSGQHGAGTYSVAAGRAGNLTAYQASASGGVAIVDGKAYLSRRISNSFGVVQIPDFSNIGIYLNNQLVTHTDSQGYAMLPNLLAYQSNMVRVEVNDLPFEAQIDATQIDAIPYFRSYIKLKFPVKHSRGGLLHIYLADGLPMPAGSTVVINGQIDQFLVADRGEVYVTGLSENNKLRASWNEQSCEFNVTLESGLGPVPKLGTYTCTGVQR